MSCCPTCGQALATSGLLVDLAQNRVSHKGQMASLVPSEAEILTVLLRAAPRPVNAELLANALWGALADQRSSNVISVHVCRLRKKLAPLDIHIETHWGRGYSLQGDAGTFANAKRAVARRRAA